MEETLQLHEKFFVRALANGHIGSHLFSKLTHLTITSGYSLHMSIVSILHPGLRHIYVSLTPLEKASWSVFFDEVVTRAPHITYFSVFYTSTDLLARFDNDFEFLGGLREIQELHLPEYFLPPTLLSILATLPDLEIISFDDPEREHLEARGGRPAALPLPSLIPGSFPVLDALSIPGTLGDIRVFYSSDNSPRNITTLRIFGLEIDSTDSIRQFLEFLVETCPSLEEFALRCFSGEVTLANDDDPDPEIDLSFTSFRPLLTLHNLTRFECYNFNPLIMTMNDLVGMAESWPYIEFLHLAPEPWHLQEPSLKLSDLSIVAEQFENLLHLGLYLDARTASEFPAIETQFPALRSIFFGTSPISNPERVGPYILELCPDLEYYVSPDDFTCAASAAMERDVDDFSDEYDSHWDNVFRFFDSRGLDGTNYVMMYDPE